LTEIPDKATLDALNNTVVDEFRVKGGKPGGQFEGKDLLLLTTTGAKSRQSRLAPLAYLTIDGKMIVVGSLGGADHHPDWVHNLRAKPHAYIEVGTEAYDVTARELPPDEHEDTFPKVVALEPVFGEYQARTKRVLPLFELRRSE